MVNSNLGSLLHLLRLVCRVNDPGLHMLREREREERREKERGTLPFPLLFSAFVFRFFVFRVSDCLNKPIFWAKHLHNVCAQGRGAL